MGAGAEPPVFNPRTAYLTFEATEDSTRIRFQRQGTKTQITARTIYYSLDGGVTWTSYTAINPSTSGQMVTLNAGQKVMVKGTNNLYANSGSADYHLKFVFLKPTYVYGNIMSLFGGDDFAALDSFPTTTGHALKGLFRGQSNMLAHPRKDLLLPVKTVTTNSYRLLFSGCSSLTRIVCLATDISASAATTDMTDGVAATGTFFKDENMSSWEEGANGIPSGWTTEDYVEPTQNN